MELWRGSVLYFNGKRNEFVSSRELVREWFEYEIRKSRCGVIWRGEKWVGLFWRGENGRVIWDYWGNQLEIKFD